MKITAQELRIGNLVLTADGIYTVFAIGEDTVFVRKNSDSYECWLSYENIEPILLSEEWLIKFGFSNEVTVGNDLLKAEIKVNHVFGLSIINPENPEQIVNLILKK